MTGNYLNYGFSFSADGRSWTALKENVDGVALSPAVIERYNCTGVFVGLYASSNGNFADNYADFEYYRYRSTAVARDHWYHRQRNREAFRQVVRRGGRAELLTVTDSLGYLSDVWHYDTDGVLRLGAAFAKAAVKLESTCGGGP